MECSRRFFIDGVGAFTAVVLAGCGREGRSPVEAIRLGSREWMIPILMPSLTTVFGLVPIVAALDVPGGEILAPLAAVQLGGLVIATIAALIVVPALSVLVSPKAR